MCRRAETKMSSALVLFVCFMFWIGGSGCAPTGTDAISLSVPRGYVSIIELDMDGRRVGFGPFVGYYFKPKEPGDLTRLAFICFNEQSFYTRDMPENAKLFEGEAVFTRLPEADMDLPSEHRINPRFFSECSGEMASYTTVSARRVSSFSFLL